MLALRWSQHRMEIFWKIILSDDLGKKNYNTIHVEFQGRWSLYVNLFMWVVNATKVILLIKAKHVRFIEFMTCGGLWNPHKELKYMNQLNPIKVIIIEKLLAGIAMRTVDFISGNFYDLEIIHVK